MTRIPPVVFTRPGVAPGQIIARGAEQATSKLAQGVLDLQRRTTEMQRNREAAERKNKAALAFNEARIASAQAPVEQMTEIVDTAHEGLLAEAHEIEDPVLRDQVEKDLDRQFTSNMNDTRLRQVGREAGLAQAAGEEMIDIGIKGIQNGSATAGQVIDEFEDYVTAQKANVYGEDFQKEIDAAGKQLVGEQFNSLLRLSPQRAAEFAQGDLAKEFLSAGVNAARWWPPSAQTNAALSSLTNEASAIFQTDEPDREQDLERLKGEAMRYPESRRRREAVTRIDSLISRLDKSKATMAESVNRFMAALDGTSDEPLSQKPAVVNAALARVQDNNESVKGFIDRLLVRGSDLPTNWTKQLKDKGELLTQDLPGGVDQLRMVDQRSPDRAQRIAEASGDVGEAAFMSTRRITDPATRQQRLDVLKQPGAQEAITAADAQVVDRKLEKAMNKKVERILPFSWIRKGTMRFGPAESAELNNLHRYHWVKLRQQGVDDVGTLAKASRNAAIEEMLDSHAQLLVPTSGRNRVYLVPKTSWQFQSNNSEDQFDRAMAPVVTRLMRGGGAETGLLASKPIVDKDLARSYFAVQAPNGTVGFAEWDGVTGKARRITPVDQPEEFASLQQRMLNTRSDMQPTPELLAQPGETVMDPDTADEIMDMALQVFMDQNNGRVPATDADDDALLIIAGGIADRHRP